MSNAGYGNHTAPPGQGETAPPGSDAGAEATPAAAAADDVSAQSIVEGRVGRVASSVVATAPETPGADADENEASAPSGGALPGGGSGGEADPGVG